MATTTDDSTSHPDATDRPGDHGPRGPRRRGAILTSVSVHSWAGSVFGLVSEGRVRRRPSDIVRVALSALILALFAFWAEQSSAAEQEAYDLLSQLPGTGQGFFRTVATALLHKCSVPAGPRV